MNGLETQNRSSTSSREKFAQKQVKNIYQFENYLTLITKPAHRISLTRLRLGCQSQWSKFDVDSLNCAS